MLVLYRCNEGDEYQSYFTIAGVIISVLSGFAMAASGTEIVLQYVAWGLLLAVLLSWLAHGLVRRILERDERGEKRSSSDY